MRRFIIGISLYLLVCILASEFITYTNISRPLGHEFRTAHILSKKKVKKKVRKLIIGDSTGYALYPCDKDYSDIVSLACGTSISMGGHYILLRNYIEANSDNMPSEVILLLTPMSLSNDLDECAYQYFLKPFPIWEYKPLYTEHLYGRIKSIPFYWTAYLPFVHSSNYTPEKCVPQKQEYKSISQTSYEYMLLIDSLVKAHDIPLAMISTPVRDDKKQIVGKIERDLKDINHMEHLTKPYVESIKFFPAEMFHDEVHLAKTYIPNDYLEIVN